MKLKNLKKYFKEQLEFAKMTKEEAEKDIEKYALLLNELETIEKIKPN